MSKSKTRCPSFLIALLFSAGYGEVEFQVHNSVLPAFAYENAVKKGFKELTGGEYEASRLRKGAWKDTGCVAERKVSFCGSFEVYFDMHHVNHESLVNKLKRVVLGE